MNESTCSNCGEVLPPLGDAFCSFCHEQIVRPESRAAPSHQSTEPLYRGKDQPRDSKKYAIVFLVLSLLIGLATILLAIDSGIRILTEDGVGISSSGRTGWKMGQLVGASIRTIMGMTLAAFLFRGYIVCDDPERSSKFAKLKQIVESTESVSIAGVGHPNFYTNASDSELFSFFKKLESRPNEDNLKQLVFESRHRFSQMKNG